MDKDKLTRASRLIGTVYSTPIHIKVVVQLINSIIVTKQRNLIPVMDIRKRRLELGQGVGLIVGWCDSGIRQSLDH